MARPRDTTIDRAIIDAAVDLLGEAGRQHLTRQQIASRAGVSLPAVTRRHASVDDVLLAICQTPGRGPIEGVTSLREFCVAAVQSAAATFARPATRRSVIEILAAAAGDDRIEAAFARTLAEHRAEGITWIEHGRARGEVAADVDADALLDMLTGSIYYRLLWRNDAITAAEVEPLVDLVLASARPR